MQVLIANGSEVSSCVHALSAKTAAEQNALDRFAFTTIEFEPILAVVAEQVTSTVVFTPP